MQLMCMDGTTFGLTMSVAKAAKAVLCLAWCLLETVHFRLTGTVSAPLGSCWGLALLRLVAGRG